MILADHAAASAPRDWAQPLVRAVAQVRFDENLSIRLPQRLREGIRRVPHLALRLPPLPVPGWITARYRLFPTPSPLDPRVSGLLVIPGLQD